jgi:hypothetical protein
MIVSINQIYEELEKFGNEHSNIETVFSGDYYDCITSREVRYPLMVNTVGNAVLNQKEVNLTLQVVFADKYLRDDFRMRNEVQSDALRLVSDLRAYMRTWKFERFISVESVNAEVFDNRSQDITAGYMVTIQMSIFDEENYCAIPKL